MSVLNKTPISSMVDTLEHIRAVSRLPEWHWCELLDISWQDYQNIKTGQLHPTEKALEALAQHFPLTVEEITENEVDFNQLAILAEDSKSEMPERYLQAPFGRRRATMSSLDHLQKKYGWRLRTSLMHWLDVPESELQNPFAPISINLMSDICDYLVRCGLNNNDIYHMGLHSFDAAKDSLIGERLSQSRSVSEAIDCSIAEMILIYEKNCIYKLTKLSRTFALVEMRPNSEVADGLNSKYVGTQKLCTYKLGHLAAIPRYLGKPPAQVRETSCIFDGNECCRFEIQF